MISCQSCQPEPPYPEANGKCENVKICACGSGLRLPISCQVNAPKMLIKHKHTHSGASHIWIYDKHTQGAKKKYMWDGWGLCEWQWTGELEWETGTLKLRQRDVGKLSARDVLMNSPAHFVCICICVYLYQSVSVCVSVPVQICSCICVALPATVV